MVNAIYRCRFCCKNFVGDEYQNEVGIKMFSENNFPAQRKHLCIESTAGERTYGIGDYIGINTSYRGDINV